MRIYNATKSTMNLPMANGSRLIIKSGEMSKQFFPTVELLGMLVSAYTYDDIAIIMDSVAEISMGSMVSALPGYIVNTEKDAIAKFASKNKSNEKNTPTSSVDNKVTVLSGKPNDSEKSSENHQKTNSDKVNK